MSRVRNKELGIKVSPQEFEDLKRICKELGITKIQFLINSINAYKNKIQED